MKITVPEFKFSIGTKLTDNVVEYTIYDISYSILTNEWYYRYSYWDGGYEHHCKSSKRFVEKEFVKV